MNMNKGMNELMYEEYVFERMRSQTKPDDN